MPNLILAVRTAMERGSEGVRVREVGATVAACCSSLASNSLLPVSAALFPRSAGPARHGQDDLHPVLGAPDAGARVQGCRPGAQRVGCVCARPRVEGSGGARARATAAGGGCNSALTFHLCRPRALNHRADDRGIDVVRSKIKMFATQKVTLPPGRHKVRLHGRLAGTAA